MEDSYIFPFSTAQYLTSQISHTTTNAVTDHTKTTNTDTFGLPTFNVTLLSDDDDEYTSTSNENSDSCSYVTVDELQNKTLHKSNHDMLNILQINARSIPKNFAAIECLVSNINPTLI